MTEVRDKFKWFFVLSVNIFMDIGKNEEKNRINVGVYTMDN